MDDRLGTNGSGCNFEICDTVNDIHLGRRRKVALRARMHELLNEISILHVLNGEKKRGCISFRELLTVLNLMYRRAKSLLSWALPRYLRGSGESSCLRPKGS
jgi:hypothetical protein